MEEGICDSVDEVKVFCWQIQLRQPSVSGTVETAVKYRRGTSTAWYRLSDLFSPTKPRLVLVMYPVKDLGQDTS